MKRDSYHQDSVHTYENELRDSFHFVLGEAGQLYQGEGRLKETYERLARRLDALGISYGLVGGYALIVYGVRRFTEDIDLLISGEGLAKLHEELIGRGYVRVAQGSRNIRDAETGVQVEFVVTGEFPGDGKPKPVVFPDPDTVTHNHEGIKVLSLAVLIELKLASGMTSKGRLQDLADVQRLIGEHGLTADFAKQINPYVREKYLELLNE